MNSTQVVSRVTGLSLAALATVGSRAAEVDFRPVLSFGLFHDGNVAVVGDASGQGDDVAATSADLALSRTTPTSTLTFSYRPSYVAHRTDSNLNYFGQSVDLNFTDSSSRSSQYVFDVSGYRSERQGVRPTSPSDANTFVPRSMQTHFNARVRGTHTGRRNIIDWEVRGETDNYSVTHVTPAPTPPTCTTDAECDDHDPCTTDTCSVGACQHVSNGTCNFQSSYSAGALAAWRYEISEKSSVGLGLNIDGHFYDSLPNVYTESLGLVGGHTFDRATTLTYAAGVSRSSSSGISDTNFAANVTLGRTITEVSSLTAGIRQAFSQGSGLGGVTLDTGGYVSYTHLAPRPGITGSVTAGYWRRDPANLGSASATASTQTLSASASIGWNFNRRLSLNLSDSFSDQTSSDTAALNTSYNTIGFGLRWAIRGR